MPAPRYTSEQALSVNPSIFEAINAGLTEPLKKILSLSRLGYNPDDEYEDDFAYMRFLMLRIGADRDSKAEAHLLGRFESQADPSTSDPRKDILKALTEGDEARFAPAVGHYLKERSQSLQSKFAKGQLSSLDLYVQLCLPSEGLTLMRLTMNEGYRTDGLFDEEPYVSLRDSPRIDFDPDHWETFRS